MRLHRLATRFAEVRFNTLGFGVASFPVLAMLAEHGPMTQKALTAHLRVEQSSMAQLLGRLERDGFIEREPNPDDARSSFVTLTAKARNALPALSEVINDGNDLAVKGMTDAEIDQMLDLFHRMIANLETDGAGDGG